MFLEINKKSNQLAHVYLRRKFQTISNLSLKITIIKLFSKILSFRLTRKIIGKNSQIILLCSFTRLMHLTVQLLKTTKLAVKTNQRIGTPKIKYK